MTGKRTVAGVLLLAISMAGGGITSIAVAHRLVDGGDGFGFLSLVLGAVFGGLGWLLAENIGEAILLLLFTVALGAVILVYIQSDVLRIVVITFLCGFNIGKFAGGVYREFGT
jgi:hypothetical protein